MSIELSLAPGAGGSISSVADLDAYLAAVAGAGFGAVSLGLQQLLPALDDDGGGVERVADLLARHGLRCADVLALTIRRDDEEALANARRLARVAGTLGAAHVLTLLYTRVSDESLDRLARCADVVAAAGSRAGLEFAPETPVGSLQQAAAVVERVGPDRLGIVVDTWHFFRSGSVPADVSAVPPEWIAFVQFDDALPPISDDLMVESSNRRTWPGQGEFDLAGFATALLERAWAGVVSVEVLSEELRRLPVEEFAARAFETTLPYWHAGR